MLSDKRKTSNRLSSLFNIGHSSDAPETTSTTSSESSSRLSKVKNRLSSVTHLTPDHSPPINPRVVSGSNPSVPPVDSAPLERLSPLQPPPPINTAPRSRSASPGGQLRSRPTTPNAENGLKTPIEGNGKKIRRKSKLFGGGTSSDERVVDHGQGPPSWIVGHSGKVPYSLNALLNAEKVEELWDPEGDTFVYLFPRTSNKGPSFRIDSSVYASSHLMTRLVHGSLYSDAVFGAPPERQDRSSLGFPSSRATSPDQNLPESSSDASKGSRALSDATEDDHSEKHLYMPIALSTDNTPVTPSHAEPTLTHQDVDTLVTYRNFIAFLIGQSLIATDRHPDIFDIFMRIADILQHYQFTNVDGSTFGEVAASSFDSYVDELNLADIRHSPEKTIEAIVLGEKMRSLSLYTEGFVHAVGKFDSIKELEHPKYNLISHKTTTRMARAALDLDNRESNINNKLKDFEFQAIFSGIMNSDMADEKKKIKFKSWRSAFMNTRSFTIDYYKSKYGSWLPKAKSKKNNLTTSGLNRLVLLDIYHDMGNLYNLLVDRTNLTNRTADGFFAEDEGTDFESVVRIAMRKVLSEYDRSTPPVQPPIPFDLPLYPTLQTQGGVSDPKKEAKARSKKHKGDDLARILLSAHNQDAELRTPFLDAFRQFEVKQASGSTMDEIWEQRSGQWMFLYAVLQSLPMLVVDAPGVRFTEGVEYFLCEVPRSGVPWGRDDTNNRRTWFGVAGGAQVVSLPTDVVEHGVEGVYRRSHCWKMAQVWSQDDTLLRAAVEELNGNVPPLPAPPSLLDPSAAMQPRNRSSSPHDRRRESVMNLGLEALPLPPGIAPPTANSPVSRPASSSDPLKTFDAILGSTAAPKDKKKKK